MSITASVLILSADDSLREEAKLAFDQLGPEGPRFRLVTSANQLFDVLRTQPIDLVLAEFSESPKELSSLVRQIHTSVPHTRIAAILRPEGFAEEINESAVLIDAMRAGACDFLRRPLSTVDIERLVETKSDFGIQPDAGLAQSTGSRRVVHQQ